MVTAFIPSRTNGKQLGALSPQQCTQPDNILTGAHTGFFFKQLLLVFMKSEIITRIRGVLFCFSLGTEAWCGCGFSDIIRVILIPLWCWAAVSVFVLGSLLHRKMSWCWSYIILTSSVIKVAVCDGCMCSHQVKQPIKLVKTPTLDSRNLLQWAHSPINWMTTGLVSHQTWCLESVA